MLRVGFIGIGNMGGGMAWNLARKGGQRMGKEGLRVLDTREEVLEQFVRKAKDVGICVKGTTSVKELARESDVIFLSLPSERICEDVVFGEKGIVKEWEKCLESKKRVIIDHGTFSKKFVTRNYEKLKMVVKDAEYMDAPVSGGPSGAIDGTLTIMCGGNEEVFKRSSTLLETMGSNVMYFGKSGSGAAAKLVNQCLVTAHAQAAVEAIHMAESLNLVDLGVSQSRFDASNMDKEKKLIKMLSSSWGHSKVLELILNDYISIRRKPSPNDDNCSKESISAADIPSAMIPPSRAPLRNLHKDMQCALSDLKEVIATRQCPGNETCIDTIVGEEYPVFSKSAEQVSSACSDVSGRPSLSDGPFLSLIELLRKQTKSV